MVSFTPTQGPYQDTHQYPNQYPVTIPFDTFSPSYQNKNEPYANSPRETDDFKFSFSSDSAPSISTDSPAPQNTYFLPSGNDFDPHDKVQLSPDLALDVMKTDPWETLDLSSLPQDMMVSPGVNPMHLLNDFQFNPDGIDDNQPLFPTLFPETVPPQTTIPQTTIAQLPPNPQLQQPPYLQAQSHQQQRQRQPPTRLQNKRYLRRQQSSSSGSSQRSSATPPPAASRRSSSASSTPRAATSATTATDTTSTTGPRKTAHNMIEKRYRTNINDKLLALRDAVPSLRLIAAQGQTEDSEMPNEATALSMSEGGPVKRVKMAAELGTTAPPPPGGKLYKAAILEKAREYILALERQRDELARDNDLLRGRMAGFEALVMARGGRDGTWH